MKRNMDCLRKSRPSLCSCRSWRAATVAACVFQASSSFVIMPHTTTQGLPSTPLSHNLKRCSLLAVGYPMAIFHPRRRLIVKSGPTDEVQSKPPAAGTDEGTPPEAKVTVRGGVNQRPPVTPEEVAMLRGSPVASPEDAKHDLLHLIPRITDLSKQRYRMEYLIQILEESYSPILTSDFFNFGTQGDWHFAFPNARLMLKNKPVKIKKLLQRIEPDGETDEQGRLTNFVRWEKADEGCDGMLEVGCDYKLDNQGLMLVEVTGHRLLPEKMPDDPQDLVMQLQQGMPPEVFAPNKNGFATIYLDADIRIILVDGPRYQKKVNVFVRDSAVLSVTRDEDDEEAAK
ncbi:unnamed protein product [Choristocarpus tenellus]